MSSVCCQEKQNALLPSWTKFVIGKSVGTFFVDTPMGLKGDDAWTLGQLVDLIMQIHSTFTPPFVIVIYTQYGMTEVQRALGQRQSPTKSPSKKGGAKDEQLELTQFIMVKVKHTSPDSCCCIQTLF